MSTKTEAALALYKANHETKTNAEIVKLFITELKMSTAGARTYAYNAKKAMGGVAAKKAPKKAPSKKVKVVKAKVDKAGKLTVETTAPEVSVDTDAKRKTNAALFAEFHNKKVREKKAAKAA